VEAYESGALAEFVVQETEGRDLKSGALAVEAV
jgi:hypothetical protein